MAVVSATSNGVVENASVTNEEKKGWLSKRSHFTYRWKPTWFELKESQLLYGDNEQDLRKSINLIGALIEKSEGDGPFGWTITPKNDRRTFHLRAGTETAQQGWMLAICEAQLSSRLHASNACVVQ